MKRISSKWTFFYKRVFPVWWFGFIVFFALSAILLRGSGSWAPLFPVLIAAMGMAIFGYVLFRTLLFDLVDEVWDDNDALVVKNAGVEERVTLKNVVNVGFSTMITPERITLTLREPCRLGKEFTFMPPARLWPFGRNRIVGELIERIDRARD
jgi:hypothetical protein